MMQRVRSIQRSGAQEATKGPDQQQAYCARARQLHPVNILSTVDFVPYVCPRAPHFLLIGHFGAVFFLSRRCGYPEVTLMATLHTRCDFSHSERAVLDYLHNNLQRSNAPLMLAMVALLLSYFELYSNRR
jgi:hypothetical protein